MQSQVRAPVEAPHTHSPDAFFLESLKPTSISNLVLPQDFLYIYNYIRIRIINKWNNQNEYINTLGCLHFLFLIVLYTLPTTFGII